MLHNLVQVEVAGEQLLIVTAAEQLLTAGYQPAGRCRPLVAEHWHDITGHRMCVDGGMFLAVNSPLDGVNQAVATAGFRKLEKGTAEKSFSVLQKRHVHGIVHTSGQHCFDVGAVGVSAKNVG